MNLYQRVYGWLKSPWVKVVITDQSLRTNVLPGRYFQTCKWDVELAYQLEGFLNFLTKVYMWLWRIAASSFQLLHRNFCCFTTHRFHTNKFGCQQCTRVSSSGDYWGFLTKQHPQAYKHLYDHDDSTNCCDVGGTPRFLWQSAKAW